MDKASPRSPAAAGPIARWPVVSPPARTVAGLASRAPRLGPGSAAGDAPAPGLAAVVWHPGDGEQAHTHGAVALLAEGVAGGASGALAAQLAAETFVDGFYAASPTLGVAVAGARALASYNRWLHAMARSEGELAGARCGLTALVLRGRSAHLLHAGGGRAWHLHGGRLHPVSGDGGGAARALGGDGEVRIDHGLVPLAAGDRLLLTGAAVHGALAPAALAAALARGEPAQATAAAICDRAAAAGAAGALAVAVIDIVSLPAADAAGLAALAAGLPVPPAPAVGAVIDGLRLERQLSDGEQTRTFLVRNAAGERFVAKFPRPERTGEDAARAAFVRERLIAARVSAPAVGQVIALPPAAQSRVYTLMPFYAGETLEARLRAGPPGLAAGLAIAVPLARGIVALHRQGIVHRDIKPDNVLIAADGPPGARVRLIDFGVARIPGLEDDAAAGAGAAAVPGSHGYLAPELYRGAPGDAASDQFAFGVVLYRLFTGQFPFTDLQALHRPGRDSPADPQALAPGLPTWLALALRRAVQGAPGDRFADMAELLHVLERGSAAPAPRPRPLPLLARDPVRVWQMIAAGLMLVIIALLLRG